MGRFLQSLLSQRAAPALGIVVLVLVVYLVGTLSGVPMVWLHVAASAIVVVGGFVLWLRQRSAQRAAGALEAALKAQGQSQAAGARPDQRAGIEELKSAFDESLELLRKSKMGRGALHSIPWFMLIGPPGSGKSTLLRQSGLSFPYMTKGRSAIRGLGGTKNCDWWFADRGILLDTAGRYTTEAEDRDEWMSFLRLLKRGRGKRPVNGVVVAMGLAELAESTDAELDLHAENVRDRIDELTRELQAVFPVYVVFTKCDRLRGFVETFDTLNKDQRKQVWGFTFPFQRGREFVLSEQFGKEFDELYRALTARRIELLASDHFKKRKAQVYAFPLQFLRLKERLQGFLGKVQQANPYQEVSPVRGVYFTSGTQEGTTIDRILKVLRPAELELDVPEEQRRCYFVDDLFERVVFDDATLAAPTAQALKREKLLRNGGLAAISALALTTLVLRWGAMSEFSSTCKDVEAAAGSRTKDPTALRAALDAQRRMLDSDNVQIDRGNVRAKLAVHYDRSLVAYAEERLNTHADAEAKRIADGLPDASVATADPAAKAKVYEAYADGRRRLAAVEDGLRALGTRTDADRTPALALWQAAVDSTPTALLHFDRLFGLPKLELVVPARDGSMKSTGEKLQGTLGREDKNDLVAAKALPFAELFPAAWRGLKETDTRFDVFSAAVADSRNWGSAALSVSAKGPLFSRLSVKTEALTIEQLFEVLQQDAEKALGRPGATSNRPLRDLAGGGWTEFVEQKRREFVALVTSDYEANWSAFLSALERVARQGTEAKAEDTFGCRRLAVIPELLAAYRFGRDVVGKLGVVTAEMQADLPRLIQQETQRHQHGEADWAKAPGADRDEAPPQVEERAKKANVYFLAERQRITDYDWREKAIRERFQELEIALVEAICNREWAACRNALTKFAKEKPFKAWNQMLAGFPFAASASADASAVQMMEAVNAMADLKATIDRLVPRSAFDLDPAFAADLEAVQELRQLLYGAAGEMQQPRIDTILDVQAEGGVAEVRIAGEDEKRRIRMPPDTEVSWPLGAAESLLLTIKLSTGESLTFGDLLDTRGNQVPPTWVYGGRLAPGPWCLKRLFSIGETKVSENKCTSTLRLRGRNDRVLLIATLLRKETAVVFDNSWPGDRYVLANTMWKTP